MKKIIALLLWLPMISRAQNSYTVSNMPAVAANFATLQGAIDSVPAGSTLYLFPSPIDYGNADISKKITLIGTGWMLDQNAAPYTTPNQSGVIISSLRFAPGSNGSYIQGLHFSGETFGVRYFRLQLDSVDNVTIDRCMLEIWPSYPDGNIEIETRNTSNCLFSHCYITTLNIRATNHSGGSLFMEIGTGSQHLQFKNNIFDNRGADAGMTFNYYTDPRFYGDLIFTNNTFHIDVSSTNFCHYTYFNNFFISVNPTKPLGGAVNMDGPGGFNITNVPNLFSTTSGNSLGVNADSIFSYATFGYHSFDQGWQVVDSSFAKHFASDGGEVGAYGGYSPYVLSGIPPLPWIYSMTTSPDPKTRGNLLIHIKAKASN